MWEPEACPAGTICKDGVIGGCLAGLSFNAEAGRCEPCRAGYQCPKGIEIGCDVLKYQDQPGQSACKACAAGQVSEKAYASTKCVVGKFEPMANPTSSLTIQPGMYKFRLAGGGGGSGSTSCSNCGQHVNSGAGGNGELVETDVIVIDKASAVTIKIGLGGNGGDDGTTTRGNDSEGNEDFNVAGCTYSCDAIKDVNAASCHDGLPGGQTSVSVNGRTFTAKGGGGGWSKLKLLNAANKANYKPPHAGNGQGAAGARGVIQEGVAGHAYYSDGFAGSPGWIQILQMSIPN
jgi:hypothetical protein